VDVRDKPSLGGASTALGNANSVPTNPPIIRTPSTNIKASATAAMQSSKDDWPTLNASIHQREDEAGAADQH
jgi:hypothetical protein